MQYILKSLLISFFTLIIIGCSTKEKKTIKNNVTVAIKEDIKLISLPKISFYNLKSIVENENTTISIKILDLTYTIDDIILFINGREIYGEKERALKIKNKQKIVHFKVKLQNGLNEIEAYVKNKSTGKQEEIVCSIVAKYKTNSKPKLYAIIIGIDEFKNKNLNLDYAEADATMLGGTLFKRSKNLFSNVNIKYLRKKKETSKKAILSTLESLQNISANDFFIFYVASHGVSIEKDFYLITSNIEKEDSQYIQKNAISEKDLRNSIKQIPTSNKLILFDTCYSGGINNTISKKLASNSKNLNITSISASNSNQTAYEGYADGHGLFTYILDEALNGDADTNKDGIIQSIELVNYTTKKVTAEAKKIEHIQTPISFQSGQVFNITKLKSYKDLKVVNMQPQYFQPEEIKKLVTFINLNKADEYNKIVNTKREETRKKIIKLEKENKERKMLNFIDFTKKHPMSLI